MLTDSFTPAQTSEIAGTVSADVWNGVEEFLHTGLFQNCIQILLVNIAQDDRRMIADSDIP